MRKIVNTRIVQNHDTPAGWHDRKNEIPYNGELIVYDSDDVKKSALIKIGDGKTTVENLPNI